MNVIIQLILVILGILTLSGLLGYLIGKILFSIYVKRLDKKINKPDEIERIKKLEKEQDTSTKEKEVNEYDRRKRIERERLESLKRRERGVKEPIEQLSSERGNERRSELSDSEFDKIGESKSRDEEPDRNFKENWENFD
jgi:hypothetical protein